MVVNVECMSGSHVMSCASIYYYTRSQGFGGLFSRPHNENPYQGWALKRWRLYKKKKKSSMWKMVAQKDLFTWPYDTYSNYTFPVVLILQLRLQHLYINNFGNWLQWDNWWPLLVKTCQKCLVQWITGPLHKSSLTSKPWTCSCLSHKDY